MKKNKKIYMIWLVIFAGFIVVSTSFSGAIKVNNQKSTDREESVCSTLGVDKSILYHGWPDRDQDTTDPEWEKASEDQEHLKSPSGKGARCDKYWTVSGFWPIYYVFHLDEWDITDEISSVNVEVQFRVSTLTTGGPSLYVSDGENPGTLVMGMGTQEGLEWNEYTKTEDDQPLENFVNDDGMIVFSIVNPSQTHTMVEKVRLRWTIDSYKNFPPNTPEIGGPFFDGNMNEPTRRQEMTFTGSATDPDGDEITEYKWKVDGTVQGITENTLTTHFNSGGSHSVSLKAKDEHGFWSEDWATKKFTVSDNVGPADLSITGPRKFKQGSEVEYTFEATDINKDKLTFTIDWGESTSDPEDTETHTVNPNSNGVCTLELDGPVYTLKQEYIIKLTVEDPYDETSTKTKQIEVPKTKGVDNFYKPFSKLLNLLDLLNVDINIMDF